MIAAALISLAAACPAETPAAMRLEGVPPVLVSGRSYTASLAPTGVGEATGAGWTLGVFDRLGRGWKADLPSLGFQQAFSVGLTGAPYAVSATYAEPSCTRTLSVSAAVERRVLAVADCRRGVSEPRTLVVGCDGRRVRVRGLSWRGWNEDVAVGTGAGGARVRLSRPQECVAVDGFIYTRARVDGRRYVLDCPIV
ncbi:hypothetical protein DVA67_001595 [Solirubrobacter sp. CPCC 204708]|uniref:Lipoprotein n=1 Tax=Solirubrobacter deserti TaxID=2282478 RepID=A0ABT4RDP5_9ACTN|nr:hypothetical protein [Solirubrobacter deserti]MBE2314651.1 hypothetical protein [Solirubrobacter deserti]MDA0136659.1 hypothetical protein [Solirubrobacter deserti]